MVHFLTPWLTASIGHQIGQVLVVFRIISPTGYSKQIPDRFLTYIHRFDVVPQTNAAVSGSRTARGPYPDPISSMYIVKRGRRSDNTLIGGIIPLQQVRTLVDLVPRFGSKADRCLTKDNCLMYCSEFWVNKYFYKELFYALTL